MVLVSACPRTEELKYKAVWIVEPELEYDHVYHCPLCGYSNRSQLLNKMTGQISGPHHGHGFPGIREWVYDSENGVFGTLYSDMNSMRLTVHPVDEFSTHFTSFTDTLMYVREIDSKSVTSRRDEWGFVTNNFGEKYKNSKYAIAYGGKLLTDFIYDRPGSASITLTYKNAIPVNIDGKWGFIGTSGKIIVPLIYDQIVTSDGDTAFVKVEDKFGVLDVLASTGQ